MYYFGIWFLIQKKMVNRPNVTCVNSTRYKSIYTLFPQGPKYTALYKEKNTG